jgi:hypothetical protein
MPTQYYRKKSGTPESRAKAKEREAEKVRRRYKKNLTLSRKFMPGEREHVIDMVIVLRLAGYERQQICRILNIALTQAQEILNDPAVTEKLITLRAALPAAALDLLQGYMIEAVQTLVDIMRASPDDKIVLQAASEILDRAGLGKASRQERHQINEQRTVFTDDGIVERLRQASPELQEQAAQVIEQLENLLNGAEKKEEIPSE